MKAVNDVKMNDIIQRLKTGSNVIDVTDQIELSWNADTGGGTKLTYLEANPIKYIYSPSLGIVFFMISLVFRGTAEAGEPLGFFHVGGYAPTEDIGAFGMTASKLRDCFELNYEAVGGDKYLNISTTKAIASPTGFLETVYLTGWYFCDGE